MGLEDGLEQTRALVEVFKNRRDEYVRADSKYNETELRTDFLNGFLIALGWDVLNERGVPQHLRDVVHEDTVEIQDEGAEIQSKKPDYALRVGGERKFFVEAKKPSVRIDTHRPSAFQVRRYGWSANHAISVLTNFDKLVIYDCRPIPKADDDVRIARISSYDFAQYVDKFDEIYGKLSCEALYSGQFDETFSPQNEYAGQTFDSYFLEQIERWRADLAVDLLTQNRNLSNEDLNFLVQRLINRILFLRICEDRALEKAKALKQVENYEGLKAVFRAADERYNSGLFDFIEDRLSLEIEVGDKLLVSIFKELYYPDSPYNFAVVESGLLGEVYELFLARTIKLQEGRIEIVEKPEIRESGGVVSTPGFVVNSIINSTLKPLCDGKSPAELSGLKLADISCGSGSFLVAAYEFLKQHYVEWYLADGPENHTDTIYRANGNEWRLMLSEKRKILLDSIYGVDIDIQAAEVTRFSLLLKALEDTSSGEVETFFANYGVRALPKLESNIQSGNSLVDSSYFDFRAAVEDLETINPFDWPDSFSEIMESGGFDVIIGNPPYVRIQNMVKYSPNEVEYYKSPGSPYSTAKTDNFDKYNLFIERSLSLLKPDGWLGYIVPHKFSVTQAGKTLRALISSGSHLSDFIHFGIQQVFGIRVITYVCIIRLSKEPQEQFTIEQVGDLSSWRRGQREPKVLLAANEINETPWNFASEPIKEFFDRINALNVAKLSVVADIFVGLQTSADKIYILGPTSEEENYIVLEDRAGNEYQIERDILRPCLYDVHFKDFLPPEHNSYLIFPYKIVEGRAILYTPAEMEAQFPNALGYLALHKEALARRNVPNRTEENWYQFGRSQSLTKFDGSPKLIWSILLKSLEPRYIYDDKNVTFTGGGNGPYYGLRIKEDSDSAFFNDRPDDTLFYLQAILHHPVIDAMVDGSVFQGGYVSHGKQFIAHLPIRVVNADSQNDVDLYNAIVEVTKRLNTTAERVATARTPHTRDLQSRRQFVLRREMNRLVEDLYGITQIDIDLVKEVNE